MGLQVMVSKPTGKQTATGEIRDDVKENSPLAMMATALQDALEAALGFMAEYAGVPMAATDAESDDKGGSVVVNHEFGISGDLATWQFITQAYVAGKLDTETYVNEGKRRGVFAEDVDPETITSRVSAMTAAAAPDLSAGVPPGKGMKLDEAA
jgi:hypothetical protein